MITATILSNISQNSPKFKLKLLRCLDKSMWYSSFPIGTLLYYGGSDRWDSDIYWSREPGGYVNIVKKTDVELIEE